MQLKRSILLWHKEATQLSEVINHHSPRGVLKTRFGIHVAQKLEETAPVSPPLGKSSENKQTHKHHSGKGEDAKPSKLKWKT